VRAALQFPLGDQETELACLVKMYDIDGGDDSLQFPVNGMFDFIGILALDTELTEFNGQGGAAMDVDDAFMSEYVAHNPPASMVPRLHCVCFRPVPPQSPVLPSGPYRSALLTSSTDQTSTQPPAAAAAAFPDTISAAGALVQRLQGSGSFQQTRAWVVELLSSALGGDRLAGEYMLLNMISRVHSRMDATPLGNVSLGITHMGTTNPQDVIAAVNTYVTRFVLPVFCLLSSIFSIFYLRCVFLLSLTC